MPEKKTAENTGVLIKGEEMARREIQTDMTAGSPFKIILNFTIPIFIGNVFQQFYNMADTIIVGKFVGTGALAAVGSVGTIVFLIIGFLQGLTAGFSVLTAQRFGAGDMKNMRKSVGTACVLSVIITVIMTAGSMLGMKRLLEFMNTPADIFADAYAYIMIICGGIAATVLYNLLSGILRALGDSKTPLYFLILSALLNVGLDLFFIIVVPHGSGRSRLCYGDLPGGIRHRMSDLYCEESAFTENAGGGFPAGRIPGENGDGGGNSHGSSVFHHSYRDYDGPVLPELCWAPCLWRHLLRLTRSSPWLPRLMWPWEPPWQPTVPRT